MSEQRVGTCSICGGSVMGIRGAWLSVDPLPPDKCRSCGVVVRSDVIAMELPPGYGTAVRQDTGEEIIVRMKPHVVLSD